MKRGNQSGFTLIELIMVIVILGALAAFSLPRFADLGADARRASVEGALGAVRSASAISHAAALASGAAAGASISLEGQTVTMAFHYPTGDTAGIATAAQLGASGENYLLDDTTTAGTLTIRPLGATGTTCEISYVQPTAAGNAPVISMTSGSLTNC